MNIEFLNLKDINLPVEQALMEAAERVIRSGRYLHGTETKAFETELARTCVDAPEKGKEPAPIPEAVGCSNGLDAIRLILRGFIELGRLQPGDEVIVPANTYIASILPISEFGLIPVLCEPDPITMNLDFNEARRLITSNTKAVMLVHLYGTPCWDLSFALECRERGISVIEDNAQAIGAMAVEEGLNGSRHTGNLADAAAFSFYPTKNIGALGDAGAVVTPNKELAQTVRALANYGSDTRYHNIYQGYNCRMDEIQAAFLRVQLSRLDLTTRLRLIMAMYYNTLITNPAVEKPLFMEKGLQVWHQYVVRVADRDRFRKELAEQGIATDVHYAVPPHLQPCYAGKFKERYPITERLADSVVSLPIASVSMDQANLIIQAVNRFQG